MAVPIGVQLEVCEALTDVRDVMQEYGDDVDFFLQGETDITRDTYNSIKQDKITKNFTFKCYPITNNPTQQQMEKAGIFQKCDMMIYSATKDWTLNSKTINDIDVTRSMIVYQGETYNIKEKNNVSQIGSTYLYITLGLSKR